MSKEQKAGTTGGIKRLSAFILISLAGLAISLYSPWGPYLTVDRIRVFADGLGCWGPALILAAGLLTPLAFLPRWPLAFLAGLLYGVVWGSLLANLASAAGALLHFFLARTLLAPFSARLRIRYGLDRFSIPPEKGFLAILLLRAFPLSSFVATNLLAGALNMHAGRFLAASFLGMIPSTLMYASWGKLLKKPDASFYGLAVASLLFIVIGTYLGKRMLMRWTKDSGFRVQGSTLSEP